ncbi:unnamed protein product [Cuscuta europaea]|uniref:Uncharacterized protein n=1 Tax=Cuscuta europaea TaxID=41803 RepID=A0A9P0YHH4_CUSEU|nr:unnamed protein product [Cuscuta europaea]
MARVFMSYCHCSKGEGGYEGKAATDRLLPNRRQIIILAIGSVRGQSVDAISGTRDGDFTATVTLHGRSFLSMSNLQPPGTSQGISKCGAELPATRRDG